MKQTNDQSRSDWFDAGDGDRVETTFGADVSIEWDVHWFDEAEPFPTDAAIPVSPSETAGSTSHAETNTTHDTTDSTTHTETTTTPDPTVTPESEPASGVEPSVADTGVAEMDGSAAAETDVSGAEEQTVETPSSPAQTEADTEARTVATDSQSETPARESTDDSGGLIAWIRSILGL